MTTALAYHREYEADAMIVDPPSRSPLVPLTPREHPHVLYVRRAKAADVPWLMVELRKFSEFFGTSKPLFPPSNHAQQFLYDLIDRHPFFVAAENGHQVGFIAGSLAPHPFNPAITVLTEMFWWVTEAARGSRAGLRLLEHFCAFGEKHADWVVFTLEHNSPVSDRSLLKRGFRHMSRDYIKEVER